MREQERSIALILIFEILDHFRLKRGEISSGKVDKNLEGARWRFRQPSDFDPSCSTER